MPAQFDLLGFGKEAEKFWFVAIEEPGFFSGDFLCCVRRAHANYGAFVPEAFEEFAKATRLFENKLGHFVRAADGAAIRAFHHGRNGLPWHAVKK